MQLIKVAPQSPEQSPDDLSNRIERVIIGFVGLALPVLLYMVAAWRPQSTATRWQLLQSISAYYYTGATAIFVGLLATLAVFLFAYQGYDNQWHTLDVIAARGAALASVLVAFFPTGVPQDYIIPPWWQPWMEHVHAVGAGPFSSPASPSLHSSFFGARILASRVIGGPRPTSSGAIRCISCAASPS